jgi:hypothetical protein
VVDVDAALAAGGAQRIALLRFCVASVTMEPVFLFLACEFRVRPTRAGAFALFDVFCAEGAPGRLSAYELLPPRELVLGATITRLQTQVDATQLAADEEVVLGTPARDLFDALVRGVHRDTHGRLSHVAATFDPRLTAHENLPGGRMNAGQRHFVEKIWVPVVRPRLVAGGFWQMATIA